MTRRFIGQKRNHAEHQPIIFKNNSDASVRGNGGNGVRGACSLDFPNMKLRLLSF